MELPIPWPTWAGDQPGTFYPRRWRRDGVVEHGWWAMTAAGPASRRRRRPGASELHPAPARPLHDENGVRGALNLYSTPGFDHGAEATARAFGAELAAAAARATVYVDQAAMARQLQEAMDARAEIEQAKGIIMANERCNADRAFDILRQASQRQNRKLRDVAKELIDRYQA